MRHFELARHLIEQVLLGAVPMPTHIKVHGETVDVEVPKAISLEWLTFRNTLLERGDHFDFGLLIRDEET